MINIRQLNPDGSTNLLTGEDIPLIEEGGRTVKEAIAQHDQTVTAMTVSEWDALDTAARAALYTSGRRIVVLSEISGGGALIALLDANGATKRICGTDIQVSGEDTRTVDTALALKAQYTLLYTNAAPSSAFAAQIVTLNLSKYKAVMIEYFTNGAQVGDLFRTEVAIGRRTAMQGTLAVWNNLVYGIRFVDTTTSGIAISDGYARSYNMSSIGNVDNQYCVPYRIWGAEGV